ncbi:2OG-Fe(II) oxygenase [Actinomadura graeca]|uniref:2OG-Fe(II) oxygenase n=1 Tax=Actinomadura graeca TaxID=2750812 RepID=A0ABX8QYC3_9ACTN|nr:2OG-Fe(II) oxygenase [Actinomadura graeca]QXJ23806.1 2OG-Fe(II) oxygenase [Actinomadura graeca]
MQVILVSRSGLHDPFFVAVSTSQVLRQSIADLAAGRCAAVRISGFMSAKICRQVLAALETASFESYGEERVQPQVLRFGVGVSDHRVDGAIADTYWEAAAASRQAWEALGLPFDPFAYCRDRLGEDWPGSVDVGTYRGRELEPGVAREPNGGFIVHYDDAQREFTDGFLDAGQIAQFAFNLYLSVPAKGGETVIWRHRWAPADEAFRLPGSYGFADGVVGTAESLEMRPKIGEALLFDPRNYHAVRPSLDARRIALGFSVALTDTGDLLTWG